jgi:F-type H+-transporting ATPase subunit b
MSRTLRHLLLTTALLALPPARLTLALQADQHTPAEHTAAISRAGEATAPGEHGEHEKAPLIPTQPDAQVWFSALWVIIIFIVLLVILYPTAWKSVLAGLKAREQRIRKDIADAEAARAKAEATLRDYNTQLAGAEQRVRDMLAKATTDAEKLATGIRMQAQQEAEEAKERATRDIEAAKNQALSEIYQQAASLSTSIAEKILRRNLNPDDQRDLVNQSLEQLQTVARA